MTRTGTIILLLIAAAIVALTVQTGMAAEILRYQAQILYLLNEQAILVGVSSGLALLTGIPLGLALSRPGARGLTDPILHLVNIGATIPTLALLALCMSGFGIGAPAAIIGLWIHGLLPVVRNTYQGVLDVPRPLLDAARGMGMNPTQILFRIEIPNALPAILAGVRTSVVLIIGTAPLAFLIGGGGLGRLIFSGIDLFEPAMMLAGAIPVALMAVAADLLLGRASVMVVPRGLAAAR